MAKFKNAEEITRFFINDGWGENTTFTELSTQEAEEKGYLFAVDGIKKGKKYFAMGVCGNIYDDSGKIACFNIPTI